MDFDFSREECLNLERSLRQEWLETDGIGGYAASTILDCHTRKYHGLLVAPIPEKNSRYVFLSKVEATILVQDNVFHFSTNKYPGVFSPTGHKYIEEFRGGQYPVVMYRVGDIQLRRSVLMVQGEHTVMLKYELLGADMPVKLHLDPLLAFRGIHELSRANDEINHAIELNGNVCTVTPYGSLPSLYFDTSLSSELIARPFWNRNLEYLKERSRGFEYQEDLLCPGTLELEMHAGDTVILRASIAPLQGNATEIWKRELSNRQALMNQYRRDPQHIRVLKSRANQFLIKNHHGQSSVIAGYPWFGEWSRDAMIALPGLTLSCGKPRKMMEVLKTFAAYEKNGRLPNFIPLSSEDKIPYNSADAPLWFYWAVQRYLMATNNLSEVENLFLPVLVRVFEAMTAGRCPKTNVQDDGLLWVGDRWTALTWMDARVGEMPVTSRHGLAVEINALWYNAVFFLKELCERVRMDLPRNLQQICDALTTSFVKTFWSEELHYCVDVVNELGEDDSGRPNQIFAASMPYSPLSEEQKVRVMEFAVKSLLTPYGLRTLSPGNANYIGEYAGNAEKRDAAYHQGTVWPWLIGHFVEAYLAVSDDVDEAREKLKWELAPLFSTHLRQGCLGTISEIFNGDPPHTWKGCFSQAWSVAEAIRAWNLLQGKGAQR